MTSLKFNPYDHISASEKKELEEQVKEYQTIIQKEKEEKEKIEYRRFNALSSEKKQQVTEIRMLWSDELAKNDWGFAERQKKERLRKLYKKEWWKFWILVPDFNFLILRLDINNSQ
jgi:hypothetical protein